MADLELFPIEPSKSTSRSARSNRGGGGEAPLAERMRPQTLEAFCGQAHLLGPGRPLHPVLSGDGALPSSILWGPPGSGKTTLAALLAHQAKLHFAPLSAVLAGVKDLRTEIASAQERNRKGIRTALFVDEIHRFNKAQQDALLPYVERGTIVLLGATTENPSFEVIPALRSRCRVFTLKPLAAEEVERIVRRALEDEENGLGKRQLNLEPEALGLLVRLGGGDARRTLTLLENAAVRGRSSIDRESVEAAVEARLPDYDKGGDAHYDVISAFIKSLRGSDPDAAMYWLARMLAGGEDPRFITRRLVIFASEDVGNADPNALGVAVTAATAFDRVGLPEGKLILAQATTYLASAPKSNSSLSAVSAADKAVEQHGSPPVPMHLRNAPTELMRAQGYAKGYRYPHEHPHHFVDEQYLPDVLRDARLYSPSDQGEEWAIGERLRRWWGAAKFPAKPDTER